MCSLSWLSLALALAVISVFWSIAECVAGLYVGLKHIQLSVLANAGQSGCEVVSALLVLWRLRAESTSAGRSPKSQTEIIARERIGIRLMGSMFVALALAVLAGCAVRFTQRAGPTDTLPGLIVSAVAAAAMLVMFFLKRAASRRLDSKTLLEDARCSLFCFKLSCLVIMGSVIHMYQNDISRRCHVTACKLWWVDSALACALCLVILRDGIRVRKNRRSCGAGRWPGFGPAVFTLTIRLSSFFPLCALSVSSRFACRTLRTSTAGAAAARATRRRPPSRRKTRSRPPLANLQLRATK